MFGDNINEQIKTPVSELIITNIDDTPHGINQKELDKLQLNKEQINDAPEGWCTMYWLEKQFKRSREALTTLITPERLLHPEWFSIFKKRGKVAEHFHPDLITLVGEQLKELPPIDWHPATSYGPFVTTVATMTARMHPELTRPYMAPDGPMVGQLILYYSPEFLSAIRQWLEGKHTMQLSEEMTKEQLKLDFGLSEYPWPYGDAKTIEEARNKMVEVFEQHLIEDPKRINRARTATEKFKRNLEMRYMKDENDAQQEYKNNNQY